MAYSYDFAARKAIYKRLTLAQLYWTRDDIMEARKLAQELGNADRECFYLDELHTVAKEIRERK
jgi:hypothetical protein